MLKPAIITFLMAMVPVVELRGAIPYGVIAGLSVQQAFVLAVIGNLLPIPFLVVFTRKVFEWLRTKSDGLDRMVCRPFPPGGDPAAGDRRMDGCSRSCHARYETQKSYACYYSGSTGGRSDSHHSYLWGRRIDLITCKTDNPENTYTQKPAFLRVFVYGWIIRSLFCLAEFLCSFSCPCNSVDESTAHTMLLESTNTNDSISSR